MRLRSIDTNHVLCWYIVYDRFANFLSQERKARIASKSTAAKKQPAKEPTTPALPVPSAPAVAESRSESNSEKPPAKPAPQPDPAPSAMVEKAVESQVTEHQERAYVTFPYYPSLEYFDNPFETAHSNHAPQQPSYMEPVYSTYSYPQPDFDSSRRSQDELSFSNSPYSGSSTFSEPNDSYHSSYTYYDNTYQTTYPNTQQSNGSQSASGSSTRYPDYFNIFS